MLHGRVTRQEVVEVATRYGVRHWPAMAFVPIRVQVVDRVAHDGHKCRHVRGIQVIRGLQVIRDRDLGGGV